MAEGEELDINTTEVDESMTKEGEGATEAEQDAVCTFIITKAAKC
jgi:hypothetical protein